MKRRFRPLDISLAVLLAGCVPSLLMAFVSYSILTSTLQDKIVVDRATLAQALSGLIGSDISRIREVVEYYATNERTPEMTLRTAGDPEVQNWLADVFFAHPQIDGMFIADGSGKLIASIPATSESMGQDFSSKEWLAQAQREKEHAFISGLYRRIPDERPATAIVAAVRARSGDITGYIGATVLVERMGRRLASLNLGEQSVVQIVDQNAVPFFDEGLRPNTATAPSKKKLLEAVKATPSGHFELASNFVTFNNVEPANWTAVIEQPMAVAYKPVRDLVSKTAVIEAWLLLGTFVAAWGVRRLYTNQFEANARFARESFFNEKILANMPIGIALIHPRTKRFLQANHRFLEMAQNLGDLAPDTELVGRSFEEVHFGVEGMLDKVAASGAPFQAREQRATGRDGHSHFLTINLLRLQDAEGATHGILFLIEDNTTDITIRKELIAANASKDDFLALLSHELRNPLSPVITMVHELERISDGDERMHNSLEIIRRNVELEARLIDDLLDITRISHGKLQLTPEIVNAHRAVDRALEICQKDIESKGLQIEVHLRAEEHHVKADPARFQQVLWNLIKNAVKFTEQGSITITSRNSPQRALVIEVRDTGIGIERERLGKIFKAFEQGASSITRRFGGLGLGLAISKAMVEAHGGTLTVSSAGAGSGATFSLELATVDAPTTADESPKSPMLAGAAKHRKILLVDDHEDTCVGMKMLLERRGYRVRTAHSVQQALEVAAAEEFELLISDLGLPDGTGYELMETLRQKRPGMPGVALSGFGMESDIEHSRNAGFTEHLIKPINLERLDTILKSVFAGQPS